MSNAELMATISTGTRAESDAAFSELVSQWQGKITGYAHKMLRDWDAAEDIFQSVMLTVFQHSGNFREIGTTKQVVSGEMYKILCAESSFASWVFSITHRRCIDAIRRRKHDALSLRASPTADFDPLSVVAGASRLPLDAIVEREEIAEFTAELGKIPDDQRAVLELFNAGFSFVEIAEASGQKLPTVKSKARLAREKLTGGVIRNRVGALVEKMFA